MANYMLRVFRPEGNFEQVRSGNNAGLWRCLARIIPSVGADGTAKATASLLWPWASWADCLFMVQDRHPDVATMITSEAIPGAARVDGSCA